MQPVKTTPSPLRWPPPGLERLQGDLLRVAGRGALAGGVLVLPLLFVTARRQDFASLGPFADAWWVTLVLATVGLGFALDALTSAARLLRRAADAVGSGYDGATVLRVMADARKDMGFLLQGSRHFSVLQPAERERLARLRVVAAGGHALAGLWLPAVLGVGLLAGAWGLMSPTGLWLATLVPAGVLYAGGVVASAMEESMARKARSAWHQQPWTADLDAGEIEAWRHDVAVRLGKDQAVPVRGVRGAGFRRGALALTALGVLVAIPVLTLIPTSAIGPVLALVAIPRMGQIQERAGRVEAFRGYRVETDPTVDAQEAGRILQSLIAVGSQWAPTSGELPPTERYDVPWLPDMQDGNPVGVEPHRWAEEIFARVVADPTPDLLAFLDGVAAHPAHEDFARLARAAELDAASARWEDDFPPGTSVANLPIPRFGGIREGAYAHLAAAAADLARGRVDEGETKVREVISVGFLLGDQGTTLIENLIGHVVVGTGGTALERYYLAAGRAMDADKVRSMAEVARRSAERIHADQLEGTEAFVRSLPDRVADENAVRGLRWESFILTATLSPCLNLHRMVFGADEEYQAFVARAHDALVRWPSEEKLFELARHGYWGSTAPGRESLIGRMLGVSMRSGPGTCSEVVRRFDDLKASF